MAFKPPPVQPDFSGLVTSLDNSRTQTTNYSLYQTILLLIKNTARSRDLLVKDLNGVDEEVSNILATSFLTENIETHLFPNSRQVLAGTGITFDDAVPNVRTISSSATGADHVPMATGAEPLQIMSDGAGHVLLVGFTGP